MNGAMIWAEILKLVRRRGRMAGLLVLTSGALVIMFSVLAARHASDPLKYGPAGGVKNYESASWLLGWLGTAAAVLLGATAGAGDRGAGVFKDLVATGRARGALFHVRWIGALLVFVPLMLLALGVLVLATTVLNGGLPAPGATLILDTSGWILLTTSTMLVVAVGVSSLIGSRAPAVTALLAWELVVSRLLLQASSLGHARDAVLMAASDHFAPASVLGSGIGYVTASAGVATAVLAAWLLVALAAGHWRTRTVDA